MNLSWLILYVLPLLITWGILFLACRLSSVWDDTKTKVIATWFVLSVIPFINICVASIVLLLALYTLAECLVELYIRRKR
jgi:hypothetical protein